MAKQKTIPVPEKVSYSQIYRLLEQIDPPDLISFFLKYLPDCKPFLRAAGIVRICCPIHHEQAPSCDLNCVTGVIHCYGCHYHDRNLLDFLEQGLHWSYSDSIKRLQTGTHLQIFDDKQTARLDALDIYQVTMKFLYRLCNKHLRECYAARMRIEAGSTEEEATPYTISFLEGAAFSTLDWLFKTRKHNPDYIEHLPYGMLPPFHMIQTMLGVLIEEHNERMLTQKLPLIDQIRANKIVALSQTLLGKTSTDWVHCVTFHNGIGYNAPSRLRLRRSHQGAKDITALPGFEEGDPIGYFGLHSLNNISNDNDYKKFMTIVVEGENDAISLQENLLQINEFGIKVLATGGSSANLDKLQQAGCEKIYLMADEPSEGLGNGTEFIKGILATADHLDVRIFDRWHEITDQGADIKDPDEAVHRLGIKEVYKIISDKAAYITIDVWAYKQAVIAQQKLSEADDVRAKTRVAAEWGRCVRHSALFDEYVKNIAQKFNISPGPIIQDVLKAKDTEKAFIARIEHALEHDFTVMYKENSDLVLWHMDDRRCVKMSLVDNERTIMALASVYGDITDFFTNIVGFPSFIRIEADSESTMTQPIKKYYPEIGLYVRLALQKQVKGIKDVDQYQLLGQGLHWLVDADIDPLLVTENTPKIPYYVIGTHFYKIKCIEGDYVVIELPGPRDGNYLANVGFNTPQKPWSVEIKSVKDFEEGKAIDVLPYIDKVEDLISRHFRFSHQSTDARFLAYHLFACAIWPIFKTPVIVTMSGDTHAGKTTVANLFSPVDNRDMTLLEMSRAISSATMAAVAQLLHNSTLVVGFDEFENDGDNTHKSKVVADITEMLRKLSSQEGVPVDRGTKDGTAKQYFLKTFVIISAITAAIKPQDENRRFNINMVKVPGFGDSHNRILSEISLKEWHQIRRALSVGMIKHIARLAEISEKIEKELLSTQLVPFPVDSRFLKNYIPVASIMELFGRDWRQFVVESCMAKKEKLNAVASISTSQTLYDRIFFTASVPLPDNRAAKVALNELLATDGTANQINGLGTGFYYIADRRIGVIHWLTAQTALLAPWDNYKRQNHTGLKDLFDRHPKAIKTEDYEPLGIWTRIRQLIPGVNKYDVSVIDLNEFITESRKQSPATSTLQVAPSANPIAVLEMRKTRANDNLP
jgi:hypothetical protein